MIPGFLTVAQMAERTGLSEQTVRYHCRQGNIKAEATDRIWLIPEAEAEAFQAEPGRKTPRKAKR